MKEIVTKLHDIGAIKLGTFTLKTGLMSPIYIDLRESISYPALLQAIAESMWKLVNDKQFDCICGVPYTALPMASYLSIQYSCPMVMRRKEAKDYGTRKIIEGVYAANHNCLVLEDLITSGASIFETIAPLEEAGIKVTDIAVFLDREQGGRRRIEQKGYHVHAALTMTELLDILHENKRIDEKTKASVHSFIKENAIP